MPAVQTIIAIREHSFASVDFFFSSDGTNSNSSYSLAASRPLPSSALA